MFFQDIILFVQSPFWNVSIFDEHYFNALFGTFVFPDGTKSDWESLDRLQQYFLKWFNKERTHALLTFPVVTVAMLNDGKEMVDKRYKDIVATELSEGNSFFIYTSTTVDSLSSCCFSKHQKTLSKSSNGVNYMTFDELAKTKYKDTRNNFTIFHNGSWVKGKLVELPNRPLYEVITSNNKKILVTDNHINPTFDKEKLTTELTLDDYLMFSTNPLDSFPERDEHLTYEQGFLVGAFLGDGSFGTRTPTGIYEINFSMGLNTYQKIVDVINTVSTNTACLSTPYNNVYPVRVCDKQLVAFIQRFTNWVEGTKANTKELNLDCLLQSKEFRLGILDGWYHTDGGNSNRCYTTSPKLAEHMEVLITSLGKQSIINVSDRTDEKVIIREQEFNRNYPLYCVRWYDTKNKRSMKDVYRFKNNSIYFKVESIRKINTEEEKVYCFQMENKNEPYFTLPNGIITHNCRLRNSIVDQLNEFSYSLGAGGVMSGSVNVITLNMNRFIQNILNTEEYEEAKHFTIIEEALTQQVALMHKYQVGHRKLFDYLKANKMLPANNAGYIDFDKQFLTIGLNGLLEGAEYLGYTPNNNSAYKSFVGNIHEIIGKENKRGNKLYGYKFNTEIVPAESLGVKFATWDKKDDYIVPRDCYNSYLYRVEDEELTILDKFTLHGSETTSKLDGGSACHLNLEDTPSKETCNKLLDIAVITGCPYFCINVKVTICNACNHIDKHTNRACVKCGSTDIDYATRIIGYLRRITNFSKPRQAEAAERFYHG